MNSDKRQEKYAALAHEVGCLEPDQDGFNCGADDYKDGDELCAICAAFAAITDAEDEIKTYRTAAKYWQREAKRLMRGQIK